MAFISALRKLLQNQISVRLAAVGLVVAIVSSIISSVLQVTNDLRIHAERVNDDLERIVIATTFPAKNAIYTYDLELGSEIVESLLLNEFVVFAGLYDEYGEVIAERAKPEPPSYSLPYLQTWIGDPIQEKIDFIELDAKQPEKLGTLKLTYNAHLPYRELMQASWMRQAHNFIEVALLTALLIYIFNRVLTRPVSHLSAHLKAIDIENSEGKRLGEFYNHREDELGILVKAINAQLGMVDSLISKNKTALQEAETSYQSLNALVKSLPHLINVKHVDGSPLLANPAFLKTYGIDEDDYLSKNTTETVMQSFTPSTRRLILEADEEALVSQRSVLLPEVNCTVKGNKHLALEMRKLAIQYKGQSAILTVAVDITERKEHQAYIQHLAYHDSLTDLPNRHLFIDRLEQALLRTHRSRSFGALIFVDLDNFKAINDSRGHLLGDWILTEVASRLREAVRDEDTVARLGGDEFVICMTDLGTTEDDAKEIALKRADLLLETMNLPFETQGDQIAVSASLGLAFFHDHSLTASELLRNADMAMYKAKEAGKNQLILFEKEMAESNRRLFELKEDCKKAITNQEFFLMYQPQVDTRSNKITGAEALLRWKHPTRGLVSPAEFIPLLEEGDMMPQVGELVLEMAIAQAATWHHEGKIDPKFKMCINVSPQQFRQIDFTRIVKRIIEENNIPAQNIDLEITEGMIIDNIEHTVASMKELREFGLHFSIDDFGTGYSNLNYLKRLPLDVLKVDQSFVRDIQNDPNDTAIVRTILAMADQLKLHTIAEGVETEDQLKLLEEMGCNIIQGYLYSPPLVNVEFEQLLSQFEPH